LADLSSIAHDLEFVASACDRLWQIWPQNDSLLKRALSSAAAVAYDRCFATGRRHRLTEEDVGALGRELLAVHRRVVGDRDKHVAHTADRQLENVTVTLRLSPPLETREVVDVVPLSLFHLGDDGRQLRALAALLCQEVQLRMSHLADDVLEEARAEPFSEVYGRRRFTGFSLPR
jgi:hypothetical protein